MYYSLRKMKRCKSKSNKKKESSKQIPYRSAILPTVNNKKDTIKHTHNYKAEDNSIHHLIFKMVLLEVELILNDPPPTLPPKLELKPEDESLEPEPDAELDPPE
ncbi:unnamed protein product [Ambrosiozyma monospora]|uniref:Unnamed protein product n=1 Tax=Ambrosiozyma monospora TaxID=43982 RepID=A0ACB5TPF4_AMBMO|nr:unnamed protein product [Ambrosiozyma monospora]